MKGFRIIGVVFLFAGVFILVTAAGTPKIERYKVIRTNNLFHPLGWQRKNTEIPYDLVGIIIGAEGKRRALLVGKDKQSYYVFKGDTVKDVEILDILDDHLILSCAGKQSELHFGRQVHSGTVESSKHGQDGSSLAGKTKASDAKQSEQPGRELTLAEKIEANREELNRRTRRWMISGKVTRQMFNDFLSRRGIEPGESFRNSPERQQVQDEFHMEMMEMEDRGEM